jgi:glucose dehydrogenase
MSDRLNNDSDQDPDRPRPNRREALKAGATLAAAPFLGAAASIVEAAQTLSTEGDSEDAATGWSSYAGDMASSKYSPLAQIGPGNFERLKVAWTWSSADEEITKAHPELRTWVWESTPLMVGGVLYVSTSLSQVAAIDAATGKTIWVYDPETWKGGTPSNNGFVHRGVAYWADGNDRRILFGSGDAYLICLNAQTGKPITTFGQQGRVDLTQGLGRTVDRHLYGVSWATSICPSARPPTTTTASCGPATGFSERVSSASMRAPASASGTSRWSTTGSGTTTCPRPPT